MTFVEFLWHYKDEWEYRHDLGPDENHRLLLRAWYDATQEKRRAEVAQVPEPISYEEDGEGNCLPASAFDRCDFRQGDL